MHLSVCPTSHYLSPTVSPFTRQVLINLLLNNVKMMLASTGKIITYTTTDKEAFSIKTLGELVADYNDRMAISES